MSLSSKLRGAIVVLALAIGVPVAVAQDARSGSTAEVQPGLVVNVATREVVVPLYIVWNEKAVATVVLYSGGGGGYGAVGEDGWPASKNFLIRSARMFAAHPFNVVLVGRASDVADLDGLARTSENHDQDNQAIFRAIKLKSAAPIWLIGTSMGTISVAAAAIGNGGSEIAGIVLTSSVTSRVKGAVPGQDLDKIKVPVLIVHHEQDTCKICTPYEAMNMVKKLNNSAMKKAVLVNGGGAPSGNVCGALHHHGFIGMEKEVVDLISTWISNPTQ
jgi:hypothetical protein